MFIHKQDIVLETGVEMWLESQVDNDGVMMTVDMGIHAVETLEDLTDQTWECFGKGNAYIPRRLEYINICYGW